MVQVLKDRYGNILGSTKPEGNRENIYDKSGNRLGYFDGHKTGVLYTANDVYDIEIISAARPNVSTTQIYNIPHVRGSGFAQIYSILQGDIVKERDVGKNQSPGDKLLLLSTCDKDSNHYRDVILAKLTKKESR